MKSPARYHIYPFAAIVAGAALVPAQGRLEKGFYTDDRLGFVVRVPESWNQVPTQIDEKWIVAQFQSNREYEGHHKLDGDFAVHRPMMRVIQFDEAAIKSMVSVEKEGDTTLKTIKLPYRDYKDYVKRNLDKGGFYFTVEKQGKVAGIPVSIYELKVEKLTNDGRKRFVAYVFDGEGCDYAVEFEFLEHHFEKLKSTGAKSLNSFKFIERAVPAGNSPGDAKDDTFGKWLRLDWKKKSAKEREELRRQIEQQRADKAVAGLPEGWKVIKSKYFTILSNASPKHTGRVVEASTACREWLEDRFGKLNDEYVSKGIIRICKNYEEYKAYRTGSADAFSIDDREIATYEDKDEGNTGTVFGYLFYALYSQYMYDKDSLLHDHTPAWLSFALIDYFRSASVKGNRIEFDANEWEPDAFRTLRRKSITPKAAKDLMSVTVDDYSTGNRDGHQMDEQLVTLLRFLEGPGRQHPLLKGKEDFVLRYLRESVTAAEKHEEDHPKEATKSAETEEEEEQQARATDKSSSQRRRVICENVNKVLCNWTADQWASLNEAYEAWLKRQNYL